MGTINKLHPHPTVKNTLLSDLVYIIPVIAGNNRAAPNNRQD